MLLPAVLRFVAGEMRGFDVEVDGIAEEPIREKRRVKVGRRGEGGEERGEWRREGRKMEWRGEGGGQRGH